MRRILLDKQNRAFRQGELHEQRLRGTGEWDEVRSNVGSLLRRKGFKWMVKRIG